MVAEASYLAATWPKEKKEKIERSNCVERIKRLLIGLCKIDRHFCELHKLGRSISRPVAEKIDFTSEKIDSILWQNKRNPDLGYDFTLISSDQSISVTVEDGICVKDIYIINNIFIEFIPVLNEDIVRFVTVELLKKVFLLINEIYKPSFGIMTTDSHREHLGIKGIVPFASWMLYLTKPIDIIPKMPDGVIVKPFGTSGSLLITVQEFFTVANKRHIEIAAEVNKRLNASGILSDLGYIKNVNV